MWVEVTVIKRDDVETSGDCGDDSEDKDVKEGEWDVREKSRR